MTSPLSARRVLAIVLDGIAIVAVVFLFSQVFFGQPDQALDPMAFRIAVLSGVACLIAPGASRRVPWPLLAYAAVVAVIALRHDGLWVVPAGRSAADSVPPYPLILALLAYGLAHVFRSPIRIAVATFGLTTMVLVLAAQILYDRVRTNMVFERGGGADLVLVEQWAGLHQTGWLLAICLPLLLAVALIGRGVTQRAAGGALAMFVVAVGFINGSRTGVVTMALTVVIMMLAVLLRRGTSTRTKMIVAAMFVTIVAGAAAGEKINRRDGPINLTLKILTNHSSMPLAEKVTGDRWPIWKAATAVIIDHPLGVGVGGYFRVMQGEGYADAYLPNHRITPQSGVFQAHNTVLQAAVELGIVGGIVVVLLWAWMMRAAWRSWRLGWMPVLSLALAGAVTACFIRLLADSFLDTVAAAERARLVVAMLFGLIIALDRSRDRIERDR